MPINKLQSSRNDKNNKSQFTIDIDDEEETYFGDIGFADDGENSLASWSREANRVRFGLRNHSNNGPYENMEDIMLRQDSMSRIEQNKKGRRSSLPTDPIAMKKSSTLPQMLSLGKGSSTKSFPQDRRRSRLSAVGRSLTVRSMKTDPNDNIKDWRGSRSLAMTIGTADEGEDDENYDSSDEDVVNKFDGPSPDATLPPSRTRNKKGDMELDDVCTKYLFKADGQTEATDPNKTSFGEEYGIYGFSLNRKPSRGCRIIFSVITGVCAILLVVLVVVNVVGDGTTVSQDHDTGVVHHPSPPALSHADLLALLLPVSPDLGTLPRESPQSLALSWIEDHALNLSTTVIIRRFLLATLFYATNGKEWKNDDNSQNDWMSSGNDCFWSGVECGHNGEVLGLTLSGVGLGGNIPSEIGALSDLKTMDLSNNRLTGSIPSTIEGIASLEYIKLSENILDGVIPNGLGSLTNLTYINLSNNALMGEFPNELINLRYLESLILNNNKIAGTIPHTLDSLESLEILQLADNEFFSMIPSEIGNLEKLEIINLDNNPLKGNLPSSLGELAYLRELILSRNGHLEGSIPDSFGKLYFLEKLHLQGNKLTGQIPDGFSNLKWLNELKIEENSFENITIPPSICDLEDINVISSDCAGNPPRVLCSCCSSCFP